MSDTDYFGHREQAELKLAEQARDPGIKHIHLAMAKAYRRRLADHGQDSPDDRPRLRVA